MDIVSYLLELIETQKIVGITALGTLYKKKIPGRYDSETHSFLPPKYEIAFTTDVQEDQNLINFISEKRNISIESADYYIAEFVENIHAQLADHQQADFSPLGELKLINDQIVLETSKTIEIGFAFYGLPNVSSHPIQTPSNEEQNESDNQPVHNEIAEINSIQELNEHEERVDIENDLTAEELQIEKEVVKEIEVENTTTSDETTEITPSTTPISDPLWKPTVINRYEYDEEDEDENKSRWMGIFLKSVLTFIIIVTVIGTIVYFLFPDLYYTLKEKFFEHPVENHSSVSIDTNINHKIDSPIADSVKSPVVLTSVKKDSIPTKPISNTLVYEVIGSAMKTQKKVDEVISNLSKRGINAKKLVSMPGRLIKISLGTFTDYNLAKKFQDSLKIKLRNPEIYIQTIKPKN